MMLGRSLLMTVNPEVAAGGYDADAQAYITAVENTDGQALETGVKDAINAFVVGCKADGIWDAIQASCILAGARTRLGALTPLKGPAPTSFNFVDADYNRETGLVGDGSTKYLSSNRNHEDDPQNDHSCGVFVSTKGKNQSLMLGRGIASEAGMVNIGIDSAGLALYRSRLTSAGFVTNGSSTTGFSGLSRTASSEWRARNSGITTIYTNASVSPLTGSILIYARGSLASPTTHTDARMQFYWIGRALDLALLDARVTTLVNAIAAAIP